MEDQDSPVESAPEEMDAGVEAQAGAEQAPPPREEETTEADRAPEDSLPFEEEPETARSFERPAGPDEQRRPLREQPPPPPAPPRRPAEPAAIRDLVADIEKITDFLREALEQMEEALEIVEEAERQKTTDEREIESLRQSLRRFQRPAEPRDRPPQREPQRDQGRDRAPQGEGQRDRGRDRGRGRDRDRPPDRNQTQRDGRDQRGESREPISVGNAPPPPRRDPAPSSDVADAEASDAAHGAHSERPD